MHQGLNFGSRAVRGDFDRRRLYSGPRYEIGERYENSPKQEGKLFVQIAPSPYTDNCSGSYKLKVNGGRKETSAEE